jgi:hypothetical protein
VTYTGDVPVRVRLYAAASGSGLATYLNLTIERGATAAANVPSCSGFVADSGTYAAANGVLYTGTLADFVATHGSYAAGLLDPTASSPTTWNNTSQAAYRVTVSIQDNAAAQGLTAAPTFWWEAGTF